MDSVVIVLAVMAFLVIVPFFVLIGATARDLRETNRKIKQNEEERRKMIYGK